MNPFVLGSLISAGTSFLGGVMDRNAQATQASREMTQKIETGRKFGLHPLASIGAQTSGYQPVMSQAMTSAGNSIQMGLAQRENAKAQDSIQAKQEALIDEQILEARSRTALNMANAKRTIGGTALDPFRRRQENALIEVMLENGEVILIPNPDIYEISPTELATGRVIIEGGRGIARANEGGSSRAPAASSGNTRRANRTGR